jgi:hypothetical protein
MTPEQIAQQLHGIEYPLRESQLQHIFDAAKSERIVIVYGVSDDLVEMRGLIDDESGCYEGGNYRFDIKGFLPIHEDGSFQCDEPKTIQECRKFVERYDASFSITIHWGKPEALWTYELDERITDSVQLDIVEDDSLDCRGIAFRLPQ